MFPESVKFIFIHPIYWMNPTGWTLVIAKIQYYNNSNNNDPLVQIVTFVTLVQWIAVVQYVWIHFKILLKLIVDIYSVVSILLFWPVFIVIMAFIIVLYRSMYCCLLVSRPMERWSNHMSCLSSTCKSIASMFSHFIIIIIIIIFVLFINLNPIQHMA